MFRQTPPPGSAGKGGAVTKAISGIGTALGIGSAVLFTPALYAWTRPAMMNHLLETWQPNVATFMTWIMAGVEAFLIYGATKLLFILLVTLAAAALAARRLPGA